MLRRVRSWPELWQAQLDLNSDGSPPVGGSTAIKSNTAVEVLGLAREARGQRLLRPLDRAGCNGVKITFHGGIV